MFCGYLIYLTISTLAMSEVMTTTLLEQLNFYASQNEYTAQMFQTPFSLDNVMAASLELAAQSCQENFQWQRWNCPSMDFLRRYNARPVHFDKEDAYVTAIVTTAVIYTITKSCASGVVADCGCGAADCSDNVAQAKHLYEQHLGQQFSKDAFGRAQQHNYRAAMNLLEKMQLQHQCGCRTQTANGECVEEVCRDVLPPFEQIAVDVQHMYDEGLQLDSGMGRENTRILWSNVPLDALVFIKDSPNYCEPDAVPHWNGMLGRQCTTTEESDSCAQLCEACSLRVRSRNVVLEHACNCRFTPWTFQVQCDRCVNVEQQHYCY